MLAERAAARLYGSLSPELDVVDERVVHLAQIHYLQFIIRDFDHLVVLDFGVVTSLEVDLGLGFVVVVVNLDIGLVEVEVLEFVSSTYLRFVQPYDGTFIEINLNDDLGRCRLVFGDQGQDETVIRNLSNVTSIEIEKIDTNQFTIKTERDPPLTDTERERAREIARRNETVRQALENLDEYEFIVDPIYKVEDTSPTQIPGNYSTVDQSEGTFKVNITNDALTERDKNVVNRDPSYVQEEAVGRVRHPNEDDPADLRYTVSIDLANETVDDITDWEAIREDTTTLESEFVTIHS